MSTSILELPDDILVLIFCRYISEKELCRLDRVCRRFHDLLCSDNLPWKTALAKLTNVSYSKLKNAAGCPMIQNSRHPPTILSHLFHLPANYYYEVLFNPSRESPCLLQNDQRPPLKPRDRCSKLDCRINSTINNDHYLLSLAYRWNKDEAYNNHTLVKFISRAQTALLQYDEHKHQLWFTCKNDLRCLNLRTDQIDHAYGFYDDDVLCYKVYNDHLICLANGSQLKIICRKTNNIHLCDEPQNAKLLPGERNDILSLDIYSNDLERYLILNGSRDHTVSLRTFDVSTENNQLIWRTRVDDRVLCSRFTSDGQYFLIGTGGTSSNYPLLYNAQYRIGAGVRCIEWASSDVFIAAGFDNQFKEFDLRTGRCHYTFNDEFGNDYCSLAVSVDHNNTSNGILLGGNHHSTVRLVNRKQRQLQKVFFISKEHSPVHSLAVTSEYLFASVDRSIVALDFTNCNPSIGNSIRKL